VRALGQAIASDDINAHFVRGGTLDFARGELQARRLQQHVRDARELGYAAEDLVWLDAREASDRGQVAGASCDVFAALRAPSPGPVGTSLAEVNERLGSRSTRTLGHPNRGIERHLRAESRRRAEACTPVSFVRATEGFTPILAHQRRSVAPIFSLMIASEPQSHGFWDEAGFAQYETFADDRHLIIYGQRTSDDRIALVAAARHITSLHHRTALR